MLRAPLAEETPLLLDLALRTGLFSPQEADALLRPPLDGLHGDRLADHQHVLVSIRDQHTTPVGWTYFAQNASAPRVWDILWIGVDPTAHGQGIGAELLEGAEAIVRREGGRVIVVETSDAPPLARARRFYPSRGYAERGRVPDFYGVGEAKIVFSKTLVLREPTEGGSLAETAGEWTRVVENITATVRGRNEPLRHRCPPSTVVHA